MTDLADIATLAARVVAAAVEWVDTPNGSDADAENGLYRATREFQAACGPVPLTWGQVPVGWEVQAPDGTWYRVEATTAAGRPGWQRVTLDIAGSNREWDRAADGPVTARPGIPDYTDVAIAVLGYPQVLEDGR